MDGLRWDIFCRVVDNFGDIGVCWRLATQLATRGQGVRLWVDDARALRWMAPAGGAGIEVRTSLVPDEAYEARDVVVAAFGCALAPVVVEAIVRGNIQGGRRVCWIQLEYLSAESFVEHSHGLASPVHGGAPAGIRKWFFFPGFTRETGGLLREPGLLERQERFERADWLRAMGVDWSGETVLSLFCYEPAVLPVWLAAIACSPAQLLVTHGRATAAVQRALTALPASWNREGKVRITFLPAVSQDEFDELLWAADCNFVRGEDSLVRGLWAGAGLVWQAYPQHDAAHHAKLEAFLDWLRAPPSLRSFHRAWNGIKAGPVPELELSAWRPVVEAARGSLLGQSDLVSRLLQFIAENR